MIDIRGLSYFVAQSPIPLRGSVMPRMCWA
jgi:hypothetical protein